MLTVPISEAGKRLIELIDQLSPGEEIEITRGDEPVAKLVKNGPRKLVRQFGLGQGKLTIVAEDDEHLEHFQDYLP